jgi:hypothetical protein
LGAAVRIAGESLPADAASSPARLAAAAADAGLPPQQRLEAAYGAGRASAILGETLANTFHRAPAGAPAGNDPPTDGAGAAALYHAIETEGTTSTKVALAERGLLSPDSVADKIGVAMAAPLRNLQPMPELGPLAPRFAALFYTIGDVEAAAPWADLAEGSGSGAALWPYHVLIKQGDPIGIGDWEQQANLDPPVLARILTILSAFGVTAPPTGHAAGDDRQEPPLSELVAMDKAARQSRVGETVLRALAILGSDGPSHAHPLALRRVLADLDAVRLHNEAHTLAFEAITAALAGAPLSASHAAGP